MNTSLQLPVPLERGDQIGIIAPAGQVRDIEKFEQGADIIRSMGFIPQMPENLWPGAGYFSDTDTDRLAEIARSFANPELRAIITARGGYGCLRLMSSLSREHIRLNKKLLLGFSDITLLLNHFSSQQNTVCLHGPVVTSLAECSKPALDRLYSCLIGNWHEPITWRGLEIVRAAPLVSGKLAGGNLSTLVTLVGTPYSHIYDGSLLFLEDTGEPLYRIDRMLTQLKLAGILDRIRGLILGDFSMNPAMGKASMRHHAEGIWKRALELTEDSQIPVWGNFPAGHCSDNFTVPIGCPSTMDCQQTELRFHRDLLP